MTLRQAKPEDASSLAALSIEVWLGTYLKKGINGFFADFVLDTFTTAKTDALIRDPQQFIVVSENTDGIDGFVRVSQDCPAPVDGCSQVEIATLYVQARHHGKGIGRRLLISAFDHCRDLQVPNVWLATNAQNTPAIGFYHAQGFEQVGETHFRIGDQGYLNNVYRYWLSPPDMAETPRRA